MKFSQVVGKNHFYVDWEFQIIDGFHKNHKIDGVWLQKLDNQELIYCYSGGFDISYYIQPETGKIIQTDPIK